MIMTGANQRFSSFCGKSSFSDWFRICGIWSVFYYNFYKKLHKYEFSNKFDTVLCQFLESETSDRCLMCIVQCLRFSGFIPLSFFLYTVPLRTKNDLNFHYAIGNFFLIDDVSKTNLKNYRSQKNWVFATNSDFLISIFDSIIYYFQFISNFLIKK